MNFRDRPLSECATKFTPGELAALETCPEALRALANWHELQATMAGAIDPDIFDDAIRRHDATKDTLRAEATRIEAEL